MPAVVWFNGSIKRFEGTKALTKINKQWFDRCRIAIEEHQEQGGQ